MDPKRLREKVLEQYYPGEHELEETQQKYENIAEFIRKEFSLETHFAGSSSRKTCMKGDRDIDIFVLFPEKVERLELEDRGLEVGKTVFEEFDGDYHIEYAEHPYTKGEINSHEVEIVPCYNVSADEIKSAVDRTPHHSRWVENNLNKEQRKDVVLLKTFLRAGELYGSSLKVEGFSGYLSEILIEECGSFQELVEEASGWGEQELIDPENHHEGSLPDELEDKFSEDNLVVIDPVDPERNVASVLSTENYSRFIYRCWQFRQKPGIHFFETEETDYTEFGLKQELEKRGEFLVLEFENPEDVEDIVYPQMRKTMRRLEQVMENRDFRIFESGFHLGEKTRIFFELDRELPEIEETRGPKVFHGEDHIAQFTGKYDNVFVKEDRLYAKVEREYTDAKELLQEFLEESVEERGIPGTVAEKITDFSFTEPLEGGEKWLKYLAKKLHVEENQ